MTARMIRIALAAALILGAAAGCTAHNATASPPADGSSASAGLSEVSPGTGGSASPSASASPILPDGRSPVYLTAIDVTGRTVTFDLIEFLTGDAAKKAWQKDNPGSTDGPDDDYYIVNDNPKLRTLPVATPVEIVVVDQANPGLDTKPQDFATMPAYLHGIKPDTTDHRLAYNPFWLTVKNGQIVKMEEQFLP